MSLLKPITSKVSLLNISDIIFHMINAAYYDKPLILVSLSFGSEYKLLKTFKLIKDVSDIIFHMINAAYYDKPLIFIPMIMQ